MAWQPSGRCSWKHDCPWHIGHPTPEFTIDEVGDAAEEDPARRHRAGDAATRQPRNAAQRGEHHHRQHAAEEAAVERHAAVPELEDIERMRDVMAGVVEQNVAEPAAEDDSE